MFTKFLKKIGISNILGITLLLSIILWIAGIPFWLAMIPFGIAGAIYVVLL